MLLEPAQLMLKRSSKFNLPAGCPEGPWPSDTMALSAINRWASDHTKVGGSWGVTWLEGRRKGNSARGPQHGLGCDQHKKQGCGWSGRLEETTEGWMWYSFTEHKGADGKPLASESGHSHALTTSLGQRLVHATQREIPVELRDIAMRLRKSGTSSKDVENFLRGEVLHKGDVPAFTYSDVRHLVGATTSERAWDATDFIERLEERKRLRGLFCKFSLDFVVFAKGIFVALDCLLLAIEKLNSSSEADSKNAQGNASGT